MTTLAPRTAASACTPTGRAPGLGAPVRLSWRLIRRGAALVWLAVAAYMTIEVLVFRSAYSDAQSRRQLLEMSSSTVVRMLQGEPSAVDTAGGYAVWDAGWMLMLIVAAWTTLTATRLTRGEEDSGRAELVLSRALTGPRVLAAHLLAMAVAGAGIALAAGLPPLVLGEPAAGAVLWGLGLGALCTVFAAAAALLAQLAEPRRRATALGFGLLAAAFALRLVADSSDRYLRLRGLTPFGWVEQLDAFSGDHWEWLLAPLVAAVLFGGGALILGRHRDVGAALVRSAGAARSRLRWLGGAQSFGWRLTAGALLGWISVLAGVAFVFGLMTTALIEFIEDNETYRRMLESMGVDVSVPAVGYLSYVAAYLGLPVAAFLGWRLGTCWHEEAEGRLDNLLVRGVVRWRWLALGATSAGFAATILVATTTAALWAGTRWAGAPVTAGQVVEPMAGILTLVVLFAGIAVLGFGLAPRLTVTAPVTLAVLGYLLEAFGTSLDWPGPLVGVSPFHHLAHLPAAPMTPGAAAALCGIGASAAALGVLAFTRRDLRGP